MADPQIWSDVQVHAQTALGAVVDITAVSNANPAVASAASHPYSEGDYVLIRLKGVKLYSLGVVRVGTVASGTFEMEGIDGADLTGFTSGAAQEVTFGASADVITEVAASGGEAADVLVQTIHDKRGYNRPGVETPLVYSLTAQWVPTDPVLVEFAKAQRKGELRAVRFTFADGTVGVFAGYPSASLVPTGTAGNTVTTPAKVSARGAFMAYESV